MNKKEIRWFITGRTRAQKFVTVSVCRHRIEAIILFKQKYPRFKGEASLFARECEDYGNDIFGYGTGGIESTFDMFFDIKSLESLKTQTKHN